MVEGTAMGQPEAAAASGADRIRASGVGGGFGSFPDAGAEKACDLGLKGTSFPPDSFKLTSIT